MAVIIAFIANILVALAKTAAAVLTGSASLFAEASHSWADAGNEVFLLIAERRSSRMKDSRHPLGYGREAYFWSLFAAFGLFIVGALLSILNGINGLIDPEPASDFLVGYVVLAISFVLEGASLLQSLRQVRGPSSKYPGSPLQYILNGSNPTLRAVVAEDSAALVGLLVAALGLALHQITGNSAFDAIGSILIGLLLGGVALVLIDRNRRFLVGIEPPEIFRTQAGNALLSTPEIERVTYLHLEFVGPAKVYLVAAIDLVGDRREDEVAQQLRRLEKLTEEQEFVDTAILTLSVSDEPSITFPA